MEPAERVLDRTFLDIRAKLIVLAAALDRIDRAPGCEGLRDDRRLVGIRQALEVVRGTAANRAERVQMIFSEPYDPDWPRPEPSRS